MFFLSNQASCQLILLNQRKNKIVAFIEVEFCTGRDERCRINLFNNRRTRKPRAYRQSIPPIHRHLHRMGCRFVNETWDVVLCGFGGCSQVNLRTACAASREWRPLGVPEFNRLILKMIPVKLMMSLVKTTDRNPRNPSSERYSISCS